ncbi:hypothetical protein PN36_01095 [Candidatus Thiomargarita nelsonii]|uniref:Uncharacterized protein n=1 Tax=Candidatus Thiomargarita nelsonii TaxID=1003181 RepID=A0A4E0R7K5_9GAMM|nr:hypothetical protein PN36_01095 [Candidatus Thiomargarita nelsonii]
MFSCFGNGAARISRNEVKNVQLFREWSCADFPKRSQKCSVVSGMELRGFPETKSKMFSCFGNGAARISRNEVKNVQLFREWSCADFPKRSQKCSVVSGMELRGFPETKSKMFSCFGNFAARISRNNKLLFFLIEGCRKFLAKVLITQ